MKWSWFWFVLTISCSALYAQGTPVKVEHKGMVYVLENGQWVVTQGQATANSVAVLQNGKWGIYKGIRVGAGGSLEVMKLGKWSRAAGQSVAVDDINYKLDKGRWIVDHGVRLMKDSNEIQVYDSGVWVVKSGSSLAPPGEIRPPKEEKPVAVVPEKEKPAPVVPEKEKPVAVVPEKEKPAPVVPEKEKPVVIEKEQPIVIEPNKINKDQQLETIEGGQVVARDGFTLAVDGMMYTFEDGKWKVNHGTFMADNVTIRDAKSVRTLAKMVLRFGRDGLVSIFENGEWITQVVTDITVNGMHLLHEADWYVIEGIKLSGNGIIQILRGGKYVVVEGARILPKTPGYIYEVYDGTRYKAVNAARVVYGGLVYGYEGGKWIVESGIQILKDGYIKFNELDQRTDQAVSDTIQFVKNGIVYAWENKEWIAKEGVLFVAEGTVTVAGKAYRGIRIAADGVLWVYENDEWVVSKATEVITESIKYAYQQGKWRVTGAIRLAQAGKTYAVEFFENNQWVKQGIRVVHDGVTYVMDNGGRWFVEETASVLFRGVYYVLVNGEWYIKEGTHLVEGLAEKGKIKIREGAYWVSVEGVKFLKDGKTAMINRDGKWFEVKAGEIINGSLTYIYKNGGWLVKEGIKLGDSGIVYVLGEDNKTWLVQQVYTLVGQVGTMASGVNNALISASRSLALGDRLNNAYVAVRDTIASKSASLSKLLNSFSPRDLYHTVTNWNYRESLKKGSQMFYDNVAYHWDVVSGWIVTNVYVNPKDLIFGGGKNDVEEMTIVP